MKDRFFVPNLMNEAEYPMKNCGDRGGCTVMIRKPNSITVLLFIRNNS